MTLTACDCDPIPIKSDKSGTQTHGHFVHANGNTYHAIEIEGQRVCSTPIVRTAANLAAISALETSFAAEESDRNAAYDRRGVLIAKLANDTITDAEVKEILLIDNGLWTPP